MPSRWATSAATFGIETSVLQVATMTRSIVGGGQAAAGERLAAGDDRHVGHGLLGPAYRRLMMPTRLRIHSSLVSTRAARSSFVTTLRRLVAAEREDTRAGRGRERGGEVCHAPSLG